MITHSIGWCSEADPNGVGYVIETEYGTKVYDKEEHEEYIAEKKRVEEAIKRGSRYDRSIRLGITL